MFPLAGITPIKARKFSTRWINSHPVELAAAAIFAYHGEMERLYILDKNNQPIPADDIKQWAQQASRRVDYTEIGSLRVSTVFLGINHNYSLHCL